MSATIDLAVIGGDGIGPEVTAEALKVLRAVIPSIEVTHYSLGAEHYLKTGEILSDETVEKIRQHLSLIHI